MAGEIFLKVQDIIVLCFGDISKLSYLLTFFVLNFVSKTLVHIRYKQNMFLLQDIIRLLGIMLMLIISYIIDTQILGVEDMLYSFVCKYYIIYEALKTTQNIRRLGLPVPNNLEKLFYVFF